MKAELVSQADPNATSNGGTLRRIDDHEHEQADLSIVSGGARSRRRRDDWELTGQCDGL
jgi:hypothetical protein